MTREGKLLLFAGAGALLLYMVSRGNQGTPGGGFGPGGYGAGIAPNLPYAQNPGMNPISYTGQPIGGTNCWTGSPTGQFF